MPNEASSVELENERNWESLQANMLVGKINSLASEGKASVGLTAVLPPENVELGDIFIDGKSAGGGYSVEVIKGAKINPWDVLGHLGHHLLPKGELSSASRIPNTRTLLIGDLSGLEKDDQFYKGKIGLRYYGNDAVDRTAVVDMIVVLPTDRLSEVIDGVKEDPKMMERIMFKLIPGLSKVKNMNRAEKLRLLVDVKEGFFKHLQVNEIIEIPDGVGMGTD